jgi:hypothetical protein
MNILTNLLRIGGWIMWGIVCVPVLCFSLVGVFFDAAEADRLTRPQGGRR